MESAGPLVGVYVGMRPLVVGSGNSVWVSVQDHKKIIAEGIQFTLQSPNYVDGVRQGWRFQTSQPTPNGFKWNEDTPRDDPPKYMVAHGRNVWKRLPGQLEFQTLEQPALQRPDELGHQPGTEPGHQPATEPGHQPETEPGTEPVSGTQRGTPSASGTLLEMAQLGTPLETLRDRSRSRSRG